MGDFDAATLPSILDDLGVGIALYHPDTGAVIDANDRLEHLYGHDAERIATTTVGAYTAPSADVTRAAAVDRVRDAAAGDPQRFEWRIERANGELLWVSVRLAPVTVAGRTHVLGEHRDVTRYRSRERLLGLLSRILRHNLRNEMNVVMGYAERAEALAADETLAAHLAEIRDTAAEVGALSRSVRQIEAMADSEPAQREATSVQAVLDPLVKQARLEHPAVEFVTDVDPAVWVGADSGLEYALDHALTNAVEHNDHDRPTVTVTVETVDDRAEIRVGDNGPPIPEMETDVLEGDVETDSTYHGSGVGLWVMKRCVEAHGGDLTFGRRPTRGNVVTMSLPRIDPPGVAAHPGVDAGRGAATDGVEES